MDKSIDNEEDIIEYLLVVERRRNPRPVGGRDAQDNEVVAERVRGVTGEQE